MVRWVSHKKYFTNEVGLYNFVETKIEFGVISRKRVLYTDVTI